MSSSVAEVNLALEFVKATWMTTINVLDVLAALNSRRVVRAERDLADAQRPLVPGQRLGIPARVQ